MKIRVINTVSGLIPIDEESYDEKKKLKQGEIYTVGIKLARNYKLLKKAFSLLNTAWEYLPEKQVNGFRTKENFRRYLTVAAGYCDVFYSPKLKQFVEFPREWNFSSMEESEFQDLYEGIKRVIFSIIGRYVSEDEFMNNLIDY